MKFKLFKKILNTLKEIKYCFVLTVIFFACIFISICKEIKEEDLDKIMKRWLNEK